MKTNAARILDGLGIRYQLREYEVDEDDLSAESVARKVGLPAEQVFKTLVCRGDRHGVCFAVVPADAELDFKALARLSGDRSVEIVALKEVQPLTGYIRGGVTVLGARKEFAAYADETIELFESISISAGARGTQILLAPSDYLRATGARVGPIARTPK
jgi:Cys-tRNA(Pro)/Cys-tRNA(Cys) deacylase